MTTFLQLKLASLTSFPFTEIEKMSEENYIKFICYEGTFLLREQELDNLNLQENAAGIHQHMDLFDPSTTIFKQCNVTPEIAMAIFECIKMKGACPDSSWPQLKIDCIRAASERLGKIDYVETALKGCQDY